MKIIDRQPLPVANSEVWTPDRLETVKPYQIVVLVSLTRQEDVAFDEGSPRFPAILDTGHNHTFAIRQAQLDAWARFRPPRRGTIKVRDRSLTLLAADLWIHTNYG
jgi:hypothetical protein